jgi:hypothetical protein
MKSFKELSPMDYQQPQLPKKIEEIEMKPRNSSWHWLGGGLISECGDKKEQAFKGWITLQEDIPKGTRIHCNAYEKTMGLSITLAKLK